MKKTIKCHLKDIYRYRERALLTRFINFITFPFKIILKGYRLYLKTAHAIAQKISLPRPFNIFFPKPRKVRRYAKNGENLESFFIRLNQLGIRYSLLRWFEELPNWPTGEDIDLVVKDEDFKKLSSEFQHFPKTQAFDLYSVTAKSSWDNLPYYPPHIAHKIIENRVPYKKTYFIPSKEHHFLSFLYHVVYHKGENSGLPFSNNEGVANKKPEHDYHKILEDWEAPSDFSKSDITFLYLHKYLEQKGWSPGLDTLRKRAEHRKWVQKLLPIQPKNNGELVVFFIRERTILRDRNILETFFKRRYFLFSEIERICLNEEERERAKAFVRGGEWGKGPFPASGGPPVEMWVLFDYNPSKPSESILSKQPYLSNTNIYIKETLRNEINRNTYWWNHYNPIHSSDDELEALQYIQTTVSKEKYEQIRQKTKDIRTCYYSANSKPLSTHQSRAKVEIVNFNGTKAVQKTFKVGMEKYLQREIFAHTQLSKDCKYIPDALAVGENFLILPFIEEFSKKEKRQESLLEKRSQIIEFMKFMYDKGYCVVDFHPQNVLVTESQIYVVDFEFLYQYEEKPKRFVDHYDIKGLPKSFSGDLPRGHRGKGRNIKNTWQNIIGDLKKQ